MQNLTGRQARVVAFIEAFITKHGFPPTHAEIAKGLRFRSPNAAGEHLRLLAKKGVVILTPGVSRGLRIERDQKEAAPADGIPLVGQVAAGQPILAEQNVERSLAIDPLMFRPRAHFMLRVRGDSMIDAGILPGDLVAVNKTGTVRNGEIAVVRLEEDVTVKRWRSEKSAGATRVILEPANQAHKPIVVDPRRTEVVVEGRVVGVLRLQGG
jgi:repressor LexA